MMQSQLELRHLKTLLALAECGSVSQAAKRVFLTQSALSHQLKALEEAYGLPLFERKTQPLRFTPAGERLLLLARDVAARVVMPAMDAFRQHWPSVELDIVSGFHADPVGLLLTRRADLAITSEAEAQDGVVYQPLFAYEMVVIMARDHTGAGKTVWQAEDFADETLIQYPVPDSMLDLVRKVLRPAGVQPARRTSELTVAIIQLVASRRGVAAMPFWAVKPYLDRGYIASARIGDRGLQSELYAALRQDDAALAYMDDFLHTVREQSFATLPGLSVLG